MKKLLSLVLVMALLVSAVAVLSSCECKHEWTYTADGSVNHKMVCDLCGAEQKEAHDWTVSAVEDEDGKVANTCKYCNKVIKSYPWDSGEVRMWLANNSNNQELLDGSLAFIAGEADTEKYIDGQSLQITDTNLLEKVVARNTAASAATKTNVTFTYGNDYAWGKQMSAINTLIDSGSATTPDMFVGFVYDMVGVELNKKLANLKGSKYFAFNSEDYDPTEDEEGYFYEYMSSLSFSTKGQFLVSSNYMVDTVRAYFVTPVSIKLLKRTGLTTDSFLNLVNTNKYTWSLIADMTKGNDKGINGVAVQGDVDGYNFENGQSNTNAIWGFALASTCKLAVAGLTYATDFTIIDRSIDATTGDYKYTVDTSATNYAALAQSLKETIGSTDGIVNAYTQGNAGHSSYDGGADTTDVTGIRKAFSEQRLLVGGVIVLGAIEDSVYRDMWKTSNGGEGYIVTPMPLYKEGDQYRTVIHNLAKVIGIARSSAEFNRCAAYINYCSTHSEEILNDYFNWSLAMGTAGAFAENVTLIQKMRNRLLYTAAKVADDAMNLYLGTGSVGQWKNYTYHNLLLKYYTQGSGISTQYNNVTDAKQEAVGELQQAFIAACSVE